MTNQTKPTIVLDVSKGLVYGLFYYPVIGKTTPHRYPFAIRCRPNGQFAKYTR